MRIDNWIHSSWIHSSKGQSIFP